MVSGNPPTSELPDGAYLVINTQVFPLKKRITRIGRKLDNDLVLQDPTISRYHAEIVFAENQFTLKDLNSSGGTYLNNKKIAEGVLFPGDIILLAKIPVMFMYEGASLKSQTGKSTGELSFDNLNPETEVEDNEDD